jgi:CRP-like cAMP-binding protein
MKDVSLLAAVPLFNSLDASQIAGIAANARRERYERADVIIREGDRDARLFVIVEGAVSIYKSWGQNNQRQLRELGAGNWFGEMALLVDQQRTATVVAATDVEVLSLYQLDLAEVIRKHPELSYELLRTLAGRMQTLEDHLVSTLGGFLPICAGCKRIREEDGGWTRIEEYFSARSDVSFLPQPVPGMRPKTQPGVLLRLNS